MSLIPTSPQVPGEWPSPEELGARAAFTTPDHAPLSPQSSVASSGSEQTEEQGSSRNTFQEDGSGMKDVPSWLKSLRLHKYAALFSQMSYEEMMTLTEQHLESQVKPRGPSGRCWGQHYFAFLAAQASSVSLISIWVPASISASHL